jgi:hypothetical protein
LGQDKADSSKITDFIVQTRIAGTCERFFI